MRGKYRRRKELKVPNSNKTETLREAHEEAVAQARRDAMVEEHEKILKGGHRSKDDKGLIEEVDSLKEWKLKVIVGCTVVLALFSGGVFAKLAKLEELLTAPHSAVRK